MLNLNVLQIARLQEAFDRARLVYDSMEVSKTTCASCGCNVYDDADLWQAKQMLGAAVARLEKVLKWKEKDQGRGRFVEGV